MIEKKVWSVTGAGRGLDITRDEPSHIHLPRRRRVVRPDDQGNRTTWGSEDEHHGHAEPATRMRNACDVR